MNFTSCLLVVLAVVVHTSAALKTLDQQAVLERDSAMEKKERDETMEVANVDSGRLLSLIKEQRKVRGITQHVITAEDIKNVASQDLVGLQNIAESLNIGKADENYACRGRLRAKGCPQFDSELLATEEVERVKPPIVNNLDLACTGCDDSRAMCEQYCDKSPSCTAYTYKSKWTSGPPFELREALAFSAFKTKMYGFNMDVNCRHYAVTHSKIIGDSFDCKTYDSNTERTCTHRAWRNGCYCSWTGCRCNGCSGFCCTRYQTTTIGWKDTLCYPGAPL